MNNKTRPLFFICLGLLFGMAVMYIYNNFIADSKAENRKPVIEYGSTSGNQNSADPSIDELTNEKTVIQYVKQNHQLPNCYITKNEARKQGWNAAQGNLCEVLPEKLLVVINSATEKKHCLKVYNILKQTSIIIAETEMQTELFSQKMERFI